MQSLLTFIIEATTIIGLGSIILHALFIGHKNWMSTYCPPVAPYNPAKEIQKPKIPKPTPKPKETPSVKTLGDFSKKELIIICQSDRKKYRGYTTPLKKGTDTLRKWMETR